jgi:hypothetical protein
MTVRALLAEAWRNVVTGTTRTVVLATLLTLVVVSAVVGDALSIRQLVRDAERFQRSGGSVLTVQAEGQIDGGRCEALGELAGVRAAGAVRATDIKLTPSVLPDAPIPVSAVTPHFPQLLTDDVDAAGGVVLSAEAADALRLTPGDRFDALTGTPRVAGRYDYPDDGRRPGYGYHALVVAGTDAPFDECWVDAWPQIPNLRSMVLFTVRGDGGAEEVQPILGQLNSSPGTTFDGHQRYTDRVTRHLPLLAGALAFLLGSGALRLRRVQLASALHCRLRRRDLVAMQLLEAASWVLPAAIVGTATVLVLAAGDAGGDARTLVAVGLGGPVLAVAGAVLGTLAGTAMTCERQLFRYFKDR